MPDPIGPTGLAGPHDVERPFEVTDNAGVGNPTQGVRTGLTTTTPVDGYIPSALPPVSPISAHWLQAGELQRRVATIKALFSTDQAKAFLFDTTGVTLERLIASLQEAPLRFFGTMHAYFEGTAGRFANTDEATIKLIREEPLSNNALTRLAIFSGNLVIVIDKNDWLSHGLALADPQFAKRHEDARANLLKIDNQKFMDALRRGFNEIDRWFLVLRSLGDVRWNVLRYLSAGLSDTARLLDDIRTVLDNSARIFSPKTASEQSVTYWELKAIGHYLSNKIQLPVGYYELTKTNPSKVSDYMSKIIKYMKDYVSITETNPFKFLPEVISGLGGWRLVDDAKKLLTEGVPAWLYPIIENMIQNAMRDHLKKEGDFEGVVGLISDGSLPESAPQQIKAEPSRWRVIFVKDNGTGIPNNIKGKVFKERVHADTSAPGNGEGLLNSFQLLSRKGWHIWFDTVPGEGTMFYIGLPVSPDGIDTKTPAGSGGVAPAGGTMPIEGGRGGTEGGVTFTSIAGYADDEGAEPLSIGARAMISAGQGNGAAYGAAAAQASLVGAARVFAPVTAPVVP